jgi:hypothetical protein
MIDNFIETFKADSSLSDVSIEKTDTNHDVGQLTKLSHFFWSGWIIFWVDDFGVGGLFFARQHETTESYPDKARDQLKNQ